MAKNASITYKKKSNILVILGIFSRRPREGKFQIECKIS